MSDITYFNPLKSSGYLSTTRSNNQNYILTTDCFVWFSEQVVIIFLYNKTEECLSYSMYWLFKYNAG